MSVTKNVKSKPTAQQNRSKTTPKKSASANKAARRKKDGSADPTSSAPPAEPQEAAGAVNAQAPCPGLKSSFTSIESSVAEIEAMDLDGVQLALQASAEEHGKQVGLAVNASKVMLAHGWKIGHLLNHAKVLLKGNNTTKFGPWRAKFLIRPGNVSEKTTQRYMALAKHWKDLASLLDCKANLWEAYQECGILAPYSEQSGNKEKETKSGQYHLEKFRKEYAKIQKLLSSILQHREAALRKEIPSGDLLLPEEDRVQFKLVLEQINEFAKNLIGGAS